MIYLALVISWGFAFYLGFYLRNLQNLLVNTKDTLQEKLNPKPIVKPPSSIIDPDDPMQVASWEHKERMKQLNPEPRDDMPNL